MHIAIDARLYGLKHAGIGRYVQNLITSLSELDDKNRYTLIVNSTTKIDKKPKNVEIVYSDITHYTFAEQTKFLKTLNQINADLFHFPHFNVPFLFNKPYIVTIHDLLWHEKIGLDVTTLKAPVYLVKYLGYRLVLKNAILKAKLILVPTEIVKKAINSRFNPRAKIVVTYEAASQSFSQSSNNTIKSELKTPYVVYTGSLYPHKNVESLVGALKSLPNFHLYIASSRNVFTQRFMESVKTKNMQDRVHLLGFVPDKKLSKIYQDATALVLPSKSEGFGLTGLEAMVSGVPVICTDLPVLKEIYKDAAIFVTEPNEQFLKEAIVKLNSNTKLRGKLISQGRKVASLYSWEKLAAQTLTSYQNVYEKISPRT